MSRKNNTNKFDICFSSNSDDWETPQDLFDKLNKEFLFRLDPCSSELNYKCLTHFIRKDDGLSREWTQGNAFVNPPYSKISEWVKKCYEQWLLYNNTIVLLIPSRTDTRYFHEYIYHNCELRFIKGRLKFSNSKNSAPFPSVLCIFHKRLDRE